MSEAFIALVPIRPGEEADLRRQLAALDGGEVGAGPFATVPGTHVVRLSVVETFGARSEGHRRLHPALLMISSLVDGPVDDWLRTMAATLGPTGDSLWAHCSGYPGPASTARWLASFRLRMHMCLVGHPDPAVEQVQRALDRQRHLRDLAIRAQTLTPKELRAAYDEVFGPAVEVPV